jgi:hypothetical protein
MCGGKRIEGFFLHKNIHFCHSNINLGDANLEGTLSPSLGNLSLLHTLIIFGNYFKGGIYWKENFKKI